MKAGLLERRIRRELARPMFGASPEPLWVQRFHLSRLQAQVAALDLGADAGASPAGATGEPADWLENLRRRRVDLAATADDRMAALPPSGRREDTKRNPSSTTSTRSARSRRSSGRWRPGAASTGYNSSRKTWSGSPNRAGDGSAMPRP